MLLADGIWLPLLVRVVVVAVSEEIMVVVFATCSAIYTQRYRLGVPSCLAKRAFHVCLGPRVVRLSKDGFGWAVFYQFTQV